MKTSMHRPLTKPASFVLLLISCCTMLAACGVTSTTNVAGNNAPTTTPIATTYGQGITCGAEDTAIHYHANLQLYVQGKNEPIPAYVGFGIDSSGSDCLYWLHTHAPDGVMHIEAPTSAVTRQFMLGDFIAVWALTPDNTIAAGPPALNATHFFGLPIDAQHKLTVYIDPDGSGKFTSFMGDPNTIVLKPHENIWLEYGTPLVSPTPYSWPQGE